MELYWEPPEDNNDPIIWYSIYISDKVIQRLGSSNLEIEQSVPGSLNHEFIKRAEVDLVGDPGTHRKQCFHKLTDLQPSSVYFIIVTASNEHGEGYRTNIPTMVIIHSE